MGGAFGDGIKTIKTMFFMEKFKFFGKKIFQANDLKLTRHRLRGSDPTLPRFFRNNFIVYCIDTKLESPVRRAPGWLRRRRAPRSRPTPGCLCECGEYLKVWLWVNAMTVIE